MSGGGVAGRRRVAYLTTAYPKVSHTFIRREIEALERQGWEVVRLAIRDPGETLADEADRREAEKTRLVLGPGAAGRLAGATAALALTRPGKFVSALGLALAMNRASERGLVRHIAYLMEACYLTRLMAREGVAHVHVHFGTNSAGVARLMRRLGGPTYSVTAHGPDEFDAPIGLSLRGKIEDAAFVAGISQYGAAQLRRWAPTEMWGKIHVVRCTVGEAWLAEPTPIDPSSRTVVCVGRLSAQKGHFVLLEAMERLKAEGVETRLILAGDGEMRGEIESRIARAGLGEMVRITGWVDEAEIRRLLKEARGLVLASFAEGLPVVIMEALAMGRPVIATSIAGIPELVRHGENGWLTTAGSAEETAGAIRALMETDAATLERMGRAGRERVIARHRSDTEAARLSALLEPWALARAGG